MKGLSEIFHHTPVNWSGIADVYTRNKCSFVGDISAQISDHDFAFQGLVAYNSSGEDIIVAVHNLNSNPTTTVAYSTMSRLYGTHVRENYLHILDRILQGAQPVQSVSIIASSKHSALARIIANDTFCSINLANRKVIQLVLLSDEESSDGNNISPQQQGIVLYTLPYKKHEFEVKSNALSIFDAIKRFLIKRVW